MHVAIIRGKKNNYSLLANPWLKLLVPSGRCHHRTADKQNNWERVWGFLPGEKEVLKRVGSRAETVPQFMPPGKFPSSYSKS